MAGNQRNAYGHRDHRNLIPNGGMDVWGRGTDFVAAASGAEVASGFTYWVGGAAVHTVSQEITGSTYYIQLDVTTADATMDAGDHSSVSVTLPGHDLRGLNMGASGARTVTLSFDHAHTKTGTYCVSFRNAFSAPTRRSYVAEYTQAVANAWERSTITIPLDTTGTWATDDDTGILIAWAFSAGTTYQTAAGSWGDGNFLASSNQVNNNDNVANFSRLTRIKLEIGEFATEFETQGSSYAEERAIASDYIVAPRRNYIINGAFDIWQRGSSGISVTSGGKFTADRWKGVAGAGTATVDRSAATVPDSSVEYSHKVTGDTGVTTFQLAYNMESYEAQRLVLGQFTFQIQLYNATGAAFTPTIEIRTPDTKDDFSVMTSRVGPTDIVSCADTTWTSLVSTLDGTTITGLDRGLQLRIAIPTGNLTTTGDSIYFAKAKLEIGSFATDFSTAGVNIAEELAMCQRYYFRSLGSSYPMATGFAIDTSNCRVAFPCPVEMRADPTVTTAGVTNYRFHGAGGQVTPTTNPTSGTKISPASIYLNFIATTAFTANEVYVLRNAGADYITFDAEL